MPTRRRISTPTARLFYETFYTDYLDTAALYYQTQFTRFVEQRPHGITVGLATAGATVAHLVQGVLQSPVQLGEEIGRFASVPTLEHTPGLGALGKHLGESTARLSLEPTFEHGVEAFGALSGAALSVTGGVQVAGTLRGAVGGRPARVAEPPRGHVLDPHEARQTTARRERQEVVEHPADVSPARLETPPPPQAGELSSVAEPAPRVYYVGEVMDNGHIAGRGPGAAMRDDPVFSTPGGAQGTSPLPKNAPDFVVSPGGTAFPVPKGAMGPVPVINPVGNRTGIAFTDGAGGANSKVTTMRIMNPTLPKGSSPGYPKGYIKYENSAFPTPQGVDPYTGKTLPNSLSHFPID